VLLLRSSSWLRFIQLRAYYCRHGGTPNLGRYVRAIPQSQFVPSWYRARFVRSLPRNIWTGLTPHGQKISREILAAPDAEIEARYFSFAKEGEGEDCVHPEQGGQGNGQRLLPPPPPPGGSPRL
jgi:hypothetical protein